MTGEGRQRGENGVLAARLTYSDSKRSVGEGKNKQTNKNPKQQNNPSREEKRVSYNIVSKCKRNTLNAQTGGKSTACCGRSFQRQSGSPGGYIQPGHLNKSLSQAGRQASVIGFRVRLCHVGVQLGIQVSFRLRHVRIQLVVQLLLRQYRAGQATSPSATSTSSASKAPSAPTYHTPTSTTDSATTHSSTP